MRQVIGIGAADCANEHLVAHGPSINDEELHRSIDAIVSWKRGEASQAHAIAFAVNS